MNTATTTAINIENDICANPYAPRKDVYGGTSPNVAASKPRLTAKQRRERDDAYALECARAEAQRTINERASRGEDVSHLSIAPNGRLIDAVAELNHAFDALVRRTDRAIESAQHTIGKFHAAIDNDPAYAMSWGMDAYRAAATLKVQTIVLHTLTVADDDAFPNVTRANVVALLTKDFSVDIMREARSPARSTSPTSNLMEQEILAAKATWIDNSRFWTFG
jgi:hypothetical protein